MLLAAKDIEKGSKPGFGGWHRNPLEDVTFYHHDALGSVVMLTDDKGHAVESYQYDVYGKAYNGKFSALGQKSGPGSIFGNGFGFGLGNGKSTNVYGFTGKRYEPEVGLYAFTFRDYNPQTMRWLTIDPIKDGLNWYQYCGGDPVNWVDPMGLETIYELNHETKPSAIITVTSVITENFDGTYPTKSGDIQLTGMTGSQKVEYQSSNMSKNYTVDNVRWGEDDTTTEKYENPAQPGIYNVTIVTTGTYPTNIEHPEEGVKVHTGYWSEGCVVLGPRTNEDILKDIADIKAAGGTVTAILKVEDKRSEAEKAERPLPYDEKKSDSDQKKN